MLWLKAFHIIAMVAWFAGLFYLPRLMVYHCELTVADQESYQRFCTMERRLFWGIMTPSAIITLILGIGLLHFNIKYYMQAHWFQLKLVLILLLFFYHILCGKYVKAFKLKQNCHSAKFYRWFNELPTLILIGAVILAVVKPL